MTLGELAASIAHEINQPLGAIIVQAATAMRCLDATPSDPNETRQSLAGIANNARRAADVIARIRALAKKASIQVTQVDINEAITNVLALVRSELRLNRITVRVELESELLAIEGDPVQLQQLVLNLVMNAMDAMTGRETRDLLLSSRHLGDKVRVSVCDSGCGLDPCAAERLFDAFYTTKPAGMGMGLAICQSIIQSHGGQLSARCNVPRGAIFEFELPVRQPAHAACGRRA
jgi:C4-dicarboxylate-specific signal transduction histidine kinase